MNEDNHYLCSNCGIFCNGRENIFASFPTFSITSLLLSSIRTKERVVCSGDRENTDIPILVIYSTLRGFFSGIPIFPSHEMFF